MAAVSMMAHPPRDSFYSYTPQPVGPYQHAAHEPRTYTRHSPATSSYSHQSTAPRQHPHSRSSSTWSVERPVLNDSQKPSLPPISDLLHIADGERSRESLDASPPSSRLPYDHIPPRSERSLFPPHSADRKPSSPRPSWVEPMAPLSSGLKQSVDQAHGANPPPSFRHSSTGDGGHSPSALSTASTSSLPPYLAAITINNVDPSNQRTDSVHNIPVKPSQSQSNHASSNTSPYAATSSGIMRYSPTYPPPHPPQQAETQQQQPPAPEDLYAQRPLPANFPPPPHSGSGPALPGPPQDPNPWQHHHYISASAHTSFPPSQDRYICPTCNKAFSRPSSLKIHSHSHTGEKPFRCPHANCGKAFSVRSNMKRHERGCHSGMGFGSSGGGGSQNGDDTTMSDH